MTPTTEAELADIVRSATGPLAIRGGGTRGVPLEGAPLSVAGLSGIGLYEPGALTVVAQAGTRVADIESALAVEGQQLAFEPMDHRGLLGTAGEPTIGGVVAANVSGPRRVAVGACRDHLLGVRYVDGAGRAIKNGGRVMKNVTGYDLVKLMAGSWGTLGVLSEVSLKVLPRPETETTLWIDVPDAGAGVAALSAALGSPFEVTGAAHVPGVGAMIRIEGFADSVAYRVRRLRALLAPFGDSRDSADAAESAGAWRAVRDVEAFHGRSGDVWRLSVKPGDAPAITERLRAQALLLDWGGGLIWALMPEGTDLRARLGGFAGHATLVRADAATRVRLGMFQPEVPALAAISAGLRQKFDPQGRFNAGLMSARPAGAVEPVR